MDINWPQIRIIGLLIAFLVQLLFAILLWFRSKNKAAIYLGWTSFFAAVNAFTWFGLFYFQSNKLLWTKATWLSCLTISAYMVFIYYFTGRTKHLALKAIFWYVLYGAISLISLTTSFVINKVSDQYPYVMAEAAGPLNGFMRLFVVFGIIVGLYYLISDYRKTQGLKKLQIKYFIWGFFSYAIAGFFFNGILPLLFREKFFAYLDVPNYFSIIWIGLAIYAIFKEDLFQIKIILTEFLIIVIGALLFVQAFIIPDLKIKISAFIIFFIFCLIGYQLIRATKTEIQQEKEAKKLADDLNNLNKTLEEKVQAKTQELQNNVKDLGESKQALMNILEDMERARQKVEEEKNKTLAIIANFTDPIIVLDKNNHISMINPATERVFGLTDDDLGHEVSLTDSFSFTNFKSIIRKNFVIRKIGEVTASDSFVTEETTIETDGQESTYKITTVKVIDANKEYLGTMKIFYDLTREKMIDKLKSDFITIAAHQLRTPLSAIKWAIKLVLDGDAGAINQEQQKLLYQGYRSNERVIVLINDMLNVSRIEEGRFGYNFGVSDFRDILNAVLEDLEFPLKSRKIELIQKIPNQPLEIYMDKEKINLVLQNLVENAINYTPESGKIEITVEYGKKLLTFKIKDNGVGIPEKDKVRLFSKFFRADNVIRMQTEGSGLGLFIVKNIVNQHRGEIKYQSEEGKGTEFQVILPIK